ncbi:hypothetical protein IAR55_001199 [Kwoniella newhampshirensis]|uniref:Uncharacterized protein n=1 Tax=Kwoniella newhampshirensis TaxID=1651941 RepID=A0AAW0Z572_9TREE
MTRLAQTRRSTIRVDRATLFRGILPTLYQIEPDLFPALIFCGNRQLHEEALAVTFESLQIECSVSVAEGQVYLSKRANAILQCSRLGQLVRVLRFVHPVLSSSGQTNSMSTDGHELFEGIWTAVATVIKLCPDIRELEYALGIGIGEPMWQAIACLKELRRLTLTYPSLHPACDARHLQDFPRISPSLQQLQLPDQTANSDHSLGKVVGEGGLGFGVGWESLETLQLSLLSSTGAKNIATYLYLLTCLPIKFSTLKIETHFLDLQFSSSIGRLGTLGVLRHVDLSTTGTKFNDNCLKAIIENCAGLESLRLNDVEGRLDKDAWAAIEEWPPTFRSLEVIICEYSDHHSWVTKHLESIHMVPIEQLQRFVVRRKIHPTALLPFPPKELHVPLPVANLEPRSPPDALVEAMSQRPEALEELCLDWWQISGRDLDSILQAAKSLQILEIAITASMDQIPSASSLKTKSCIVTQDLETLPNELRDHLLQDEFATPDIKELRKFARRLPHLHHIDWTGRGGKGRWTFTRKSPSSSAINVTFMHAAVLTKTIWEQCQQPSPEYAFDEARPSISDRILVIPRSPQAAGVGEFPLLVPGKSLSPTSTSHPQTLAKDGTTRSQIVSGRTKVVTELTPCLGENPDNGKPKEKGEEQDARTTRQSEEKFGVNDPIRATVVAPSAWSQRRATSSSSTPSGKGATSIIQGASSASTAHGLTEFTPTNCHTQEVKSSPVASSAIERHRHSKQRHIPRPASPVRARGNGRSAKKKEASVEVSVHMDDGWTKVGVGKTKAPRRSSD